MPLSLSKFPDLQNGCYNLNLAHVHVKVCQKGNDRHKEEIIKFPKFSCKYIWPVTKCPMNNEFNFWDLEYLNTHIILKHNYNNHTQLFEW